MNSVVIRKVTVNHPVREIPKAFTVHVYKNNLWWMPADNLLMCGVNIYTSCECVLSYKQEHIPEVSYRKSREMERARLKRRNT